MVQTIFIATSIAFIISFLWLRHIYHLDIHRKEDIKLLIKVFIFGCLSAILAVILNDTFGLIGGEVFSLIMVGFVEEGVKYGAVKLSACNHRDFDEPMDGILFACTVALGFAFVENILYNFMGLMNPEITMDILLIRSFTPFLHLLLSGLWGASLGLYKMGHISKQSMFGTLMLMAVIHSGYDLSSLFLPEELSMLFVTFVLVSLSAVFYRKVDALNAMSPYKVNTDTNSTKASIQFCSQCGQRIENGNKFCAHCGSSIDDN